MGKIFINYTSDRVLLSRIKKYYKTKHQEKIKMNENLSRNFPGDNV